MPSGFQSQGSKESEGTRSFVQPGICFEYCGVCWHDDDYDDRDGHSDDPGNGDDDNDSDSDGFSGGIAMVAMMVATMANMSIMVSKSSLVVVVGMSETVAT